MLMMPRSPLRSETQPICPVRFPRQVDVGNRGECVITDRHQGMVGNLRIAALRWRGAVANPGIHVGDHRPPEVSDRKRRLRFLPMQVSGSPRRRKRSRKML